MVDEDIIREHFGVERLEDLTEAQFNTAVNKCKAKLNTLRASFRAPEWLAFKCGRIGASHIADMTAKTKTGWGASRANLMGS